MSSSLCMSHSLQPPLDMCKTIPVCRFPTGNDSKASTCDTLITGPDAQTSTFPPNSLLDLRQGSPCPDFDAPPPPQTTPPPPHRQDSYLWRPPIPAEHGDAVLVPRDPPPHPLFFCVAGRWYGLGWREEGRGWVRPPQRQGDPCLPPRRFPLLPTRRTHVEKVRS